jgi:hypothetical protein
VSLQLLLLRAAQGVYFHGAAGGLWGLVQSVVHPESHKGLRSSAK